MKVAIGSFLFAMIAAGCTTTQQPGGSTRVSVSLNEKLGLQSRQAHKPTAIAAANEATADADLASAQATGAARKSEIAPNAPGAPRVSTSKLAGVFAKHPYDGTSKTYFPRAAVTVTDWSRSDCWVATATVWWNKSKFEAVPAFSVCWGQSVGFSVNNAANLHLFMQQMAIDHSGNVRTTGPKPPMLASPDRPPLSERQQLAFQGFIQQLLLDAGWQPGAPTNFWLVGYDANAAIKVIATPASSTGTRQPLDSMAKEQLEQALACRVISQRFDRAEALLKQAGWNPDQGIRSVNLAEPVKVYGLSVRKVAVSRDGGEQTYRSYLVGVTVPQLVKSAALKLGKDGKTYGRLSKVGVLSAGMEGSEATLTCTVNAEGSEG